MFKILKGGIEPQIKTEFSSSADLCSREDIVIGAGETKIIPLGVRIDLEEIKKIVIKINGLDNEDGYLSECLDTFLKSHFLELKIRSSLSFNLIVANGVGEIDLDYPDEIGLIVHNPIRNRTPYRNVDDKYLAGNMIVKNDEKITIELKPCNSMEFLNSDINIKAGDRVAQIKLMEHKNYLMPEKYRTSEKRTGGYGSTR